MIRLGVFFLFTLTCAFAQVNGTLSGTVTDPSGAAVPGAKVEVFLAGGSSALLSATTNSSGLFSFTAIRPEYYDVTVTSPGFAKRTNRRVKVDTMSNQDLRITLEVASAEQVVEVSADAPSIQLASSELSRTVSQEQLTVLPTANRQVSTLFTLQAGVSDGRGPTVINGLRTSAANVTIDGINVQDNFIRTNSLDFMPFRPTIDQIAEMSIAVGNASSAVGGGAAQIAITTAGGSNAFHGTAYWYNQNNFFGANEWFNNRSGVSRPFLNLNQPGAKVSGKIIRDKLFYMGNWEDYRLKQQATQLRTVLTPSARNGIFTCARCSNTINLLNARGLQADPITAAMVQNLPLPNSTDAGDGLNTSGYRFNARSNGDRRQYVTRWDYYLNPSNIFTGTYNYTFEKNDRPDVTNTFYNAVPPNFTETNRHLASIGWRNTISPTLTNELRGGFALSPTAFVRGDDVPSLFVGSTIFTNPINSFLRQGRNTNTYSLQDNASWVKGKHEIQFGFQSQFIRTDPYNDAGIVPNYTLGISAANTQGFTTAQLPAGVNAAEVNTANSLFSSLAGMISSATQSFNVTSPTSGFVRGAGEQRILSYDTYAGYVQDRYKFNRRLTFTLGLRYEYWTVLKEKNNLYLLPALENGNFINTLLNPRAQLDFIGVGGRQMYAPDRNNFAPNFGFAFDPTGRGKTAIRGGYSISFFNDDSITAIRNNVVTNQGLAATSQIVNQTARISAAPAVPVPAYLVPRTQADTFAANRAAAIGLPDPNLRTPYVQQYSLGIQHDFKGTIVEVRYVGNHGTKLLRAFDYNQIDIRNNGFLADFLRARNNAFASERAGLGFNGGYTGPGSQPLTVFPLLSANFNNATVQNLIRTGQPGELASFYFSNNVQGAVNFFRNGNALAANTITNGGNSTYDSLQIDVNRRLNRNLQIQGNYTFGKVLSDTAGDDQNRFEPFLDFGNNSLERARASFDLTHSIKSNAYYALPFGKGQRWSSSNAFVNQVFGGWAVAGVMTWQSGFPFTILSNRGTLNRGARSSTRNTANTSLTFNQLANEVFGLRRQGNGVFFVVPGVLGPDGRAVANDGVAPFTGQVFFNPEAGTVGALQRRMFSGPWNFNLNTSMQKTFQITERQTLQIRAEAFNLTNTPGFNLGAEQDINSANFGRITGVNIGSRSMQFGLYYRF